MSPDEVFPAGFSGENKVDFLCKCFFIVKKIVGKNTLFQIEPHLKDMPLTICRVSPFLLIVFVCKSETAGKLMTIRMFRISSQIVSSFFQGHYVFADTTFFQP